MDLSREISLPLYQAIRDKYERGAYREAIVTAMFYLEQEVKKKATLRKEPIDYAQFISQVFDPPSPMLKVNELNTVAEIYEQRGIKQILLGLDDGIKNSRIYADAFDDIKSANAIICFIDYLISQIQNRYKPEFIS